jgi:AcrR family transcriptional regulator
MSTAAVDWTGLRQPPGEGLGQGSLRERKKRLMRQRLSDTATQMFLDRGFDAVRVVEVAEVCGVSEKTVYNYFPTKESLLLDRWEATTTSLRVGLADAKVAPVQGALRILGDELESITAWLGAQADPVAARVLYRRFGTMIWATPALRAHQREMTDQLVAVASEVMAVRFEMDPDDPRSQMASIAMVGLWQVQSRSLGKHLEQTGSLRRVRRAVTDDVERAAQLIDAGLRTLERADRERQQSIRIRG